MIVVHASALLIYDFHFVAFMDYIMGRLTMRQHKTYALAMAQPFYATHLKFMVTKPYLVTNMYCLFWLSKKNISATCYVNNINNLHPSVLLLANQFLYLAFQLAVLHLPVVGTVFKIYLQRNEVKPVVGIECYVQRV